MKYTCIRCGKKFEAKHKTAVCQDCHTAVCVVCGKEFKLIHPYTQKTCSSACRGVYRKESGTAKEVSAKAHATLKRKLETGEAQPHVFKKICKYCGKEFTTTSNRRVYCGDDYGPCPVCGKPTLIKDMSIGPQTCSNECRQKKIEATNLARYGCTISVNSEHSKQLAKQTCLEKYGVEHYSQSVEFAEKFKQASLERYGTEHPNQSEVVKNKIANTNIERYGGKSPTCDPVVKARARQTAEQNHGGFGFASEELLTHIKSTMLEKYGVEHPMQTAELRDKVRATNLERYGVENPMQSDEIQGKAKETSLLRYGVEYPSQNTEVKQKLRDTVLARYNVPCVFQSDEIKSKIRASLLQLYGVDNPMKLAKFQEDAKQTNLKRYGAEWYNSSQKRLKHTILDPSKVDNFIAFKQDTQKFILTNYIGPPTLTQVAKDTGVDIATISAHVINTDNQHLINYNLPSMEAEVAEFLKSCTPNIQIQQHVRDIINPYELDIYLPEYQIAIECNPTCTHNSTIADPWGGDPKHYKYHQMKSLMAQDAGVFLFHIFGYEWNHRTDVIKSMLFNLLGQSQSIYARCCKVVELSDKDCTEFLDIHHRQGSIHASIRLGLQTCNDEIVAVMTFNKLRSTIGRTNSDISAMELSRFCSKAGVHVVGGASKLFKYFVKHYSCDKIISFSDVAHTRGNLYSTLGFEMISLSAPGYVWVNYSNDTYFNRVACQKSNLSKLFDDLPDSDYTEREVMESHGYVQVFDSGVIRWEYMPSLNQP